MTLSNLCRLKTTRKQLEEFLLFVLSPVSEWFEVQGFLFRGCSL